MRSKFSSDMGRLTLPQSTASCVTWSSTMYLSSGDLPVNLPVFTERAPVEESTPSPLSRIISTSFGSERFLWALASLRSSTGSFIKKPEVIIFRLEEFMRQKVDGRPCCKPSIPLQPPLLELSACLLF